MASFNRQSSWSENGSDRNELAVHPRNQNTSTATDKSKGLARDHLRRKWAPKVRTGCATCRARRVKCDEGKPACRKCASSGRICSGYAYQSQEPRSSQIDSLNLQYAPHDPVSSSRERQILHVFRQTIIPQVASILDQQFWCEDVLRAGYSCPAIRHASLAMASMHLMSRIPEEGLSCKQARHDHCIFALTHYNAAVRAITEIMSREKPDYINREIFLICTVLFTSISVLRGTLHEIMLHTRSSLHMFYQWKFLDEDSKGRGNRQGTLLTNKTALIRLLSRLEAQIMWRGCLRDWNDPDYVRLPSKTPYRSTMDAYVEMQPLISAMTGFSRSELQNTGAEDGFSVLQDSHGLHRKAVTKWRAKYQKLRKSQQSHEVDIAQDVVVRIWLIWFEKALGLCTTKNWSCKTALNPIYEEVLDLGEKTADLMAATDQSQQDQVNGGLSYGPSICEPLALVAIHRDPSFSRRAIALLRRLGRNEGLWDTRFMASLAEARMLVEENIDECEDSLQIKKRPCGFGQHGCMCGRVVQISIEFMEGRTARLALGALDDILPGYVRDISW